MVEKFTLWLRRFWVFVVVKLEVVEALGGDGDAGGGAFGSPGHHSFIDSVCISVSFSVR